MICKPGDTIPVLSTTADPATGGGLDPLALTWKLYRNGVYDAAVVFAANSDDGNGVTLSSFVVPVGYAEGDKLRVLETATVNSITASRENCNMTVVSDYPGEIFARIGAPAGASIAADLLAIAAKTVNLPASPAAAGEYTGTLATIAGYVDTEVAAIVQAVNTIITTLGAPAGASLAADIAAISTSGGGITPADILGAQLTESYAPDGTVPTVQQILCMIWAIITQRSVEGTIVSVKKLDGSSTAMVFNLDHPTDPTVMTRSL